MIYILALILVINFLILRKLYQQKITREPKDNKRWMSFVNCYTGTFLIHKFQRDKNTNYDGLDGLIRCIVASGVGYIRNEKNEKKYSLVEIHFWNREVSISIPFPEDKKIGDLSLNSILSRNIDCPEELFKNSILSMNIDCSEELFKVMESKIDVNSSIIKSKFTFVYKDIYSDKYKNFDILDIESLAGDIVGLHSMNTEFDLSKHDIEMEFNSENVKGKVKDEDYFKECESLICCIQH